MIIEALYCYRNLFAGCVIGPGTADFFRFERIIFRAITIDNFDVAATLFSPQTMRLNLSNKQGST
ncbi:hypothetical protein D3C84_557860 [compost metagenome]